MKTPRVIDVIAVIFTIGYFGLFAALVFHIVPADNREMLNAMMGILSVVMVKIVESYAGKVHAPDVPPAAAPEAPAK